MIQSLLKSLILLFYCLFVGIINNTKTEEKCLELSEETWGRSSGNTGSTAPLLAVCSVVRPTFPSQGLGWKFDHIIVPQVATLPVRLGGIEIKGQIQPLDDFWSAIEDHVSFVNEWLFIFHPLILHRCVAAVGDSLYQLNYTAPVRVQSIGGLASFTDRSLGLDLRYTVSHLPT